MGDIVIIPQKQSTVVPEVHIYHGPISVNQVDVQNQNIRTEQLCIKKRSESNFSSQQRLP